MKIYVHIGLFGKNGILPVETLMQSIQEETKLKTAESLFMHTPSLLWFLSVEPDVGLEVLSILGMPITFILFLTCQRT